MLKQIALVLTPAERRRGVMVLALMTAAAVVDAGSIASVMPFLAVMADRSFVYSNAALSSLYKSGGFSHIDAFLTAMGLFALSFVVLAAIFRSLNIYAQQMFANRCRSDLECRLLEGYFQQPYEFFLLRNTDSLSKNILSEVDQFVDKAVSPMLQVLSNISLLFFIVVMLLAIDPLSAIVAAVVVSLLYLGIYLFIRKGVHRIGYRRTIANTQRFNSAGEALGGIKAIRVTGAEWSYLNLFRGASEINARSQALNSILAQTPKNFIEAIALGGVISFALYLISTSGDRGVGGTLAILGLYAFAGYRVLPAAQNIYQNLATLKFAASNVAMIVDEILLVGSATPLSEEGRDKVELKTALELQEVSYSYPMSGRLTLDAISLTLLSGNILGIVGPTGSGKTTLVDIILGLLQPTSGVVKVDGQRIDTSNIRSWRRNVGYVPQDIFLSDSSIVQNIALGCQKSDIDVARIESCLAMARIDDFIRTLPAGYWSEVGQRGVRLSGGQRQRIGIARALYNDPEVIVFDEATSALDNLTEAEVMASLADIGRSKTIILVAHRISTLQICDKIVVLDAGRLSSICSYEELISDQRRQPISVV